MAAVPNHSVIEPVFSRLPRKASTLMPVTEGSFEYLKCIGKGGYSRVMMARKKDTGRLYAVKVMNKLQMAQ